MMFQAFQHKKKFYTHTHTYMTAKCPSRCSRKKGKIQNNFLLGKTTLTKVSFLSLPSNLHVGYTSAKKTHANNSHYSNCSTTVKYHTQNMEYRPNFRIC